MYPADTLSSTCWLDGVLINKSSHKIKCDKDLHVCVSLPHTTGVPALQMNEIYCVRQAFLSVGMRDKTEVNSIFLKELLPWGG